MRTLFTNLIKKESGVTAIEYALIAALFAILLITALNTLQVSLSGTFTEVANGI